MKEKIGRSQGFSYFIITLMRSFSKILAIFIFYSGCGENVTYYLLAVRCGVVR
jgi:hypothetical protein